MGYSTWAWCSFIWFFGVILGGIFDGLATDPGAHSALNTIMNMNVLKVSTLATAVPGGSFWTALGALLTWNYSFFYGDLQLFRWLIVLVTSGPIMFIIFTQVVLPGILNALGFVGRIFAR